MDLPDALHPWDMAIPEATVLQKALAARVSNRSKIDPKKLDLIAGVDVSSSKDSPLLTAGVVVWSRSKGQIADSSSAQIEGTFPYVPGHLSFREIPALLEAIKGLTITPDLFMVDGHGIAHPRRLGIAAHLGVLLDMPTIGVAKNRLTGTEGQLDLSQGSTAPLMDGPEVIGQLVRTRANVKPVYVSNGQYMNLDDAVKIVLSCARGYRIPEPTRLAHNFVNEVRLAGMASAPIIP